MRKNLKDVEESVTRKDPERIAMLAHGLKGAAANLSAEALRQAAADMEQLARSGDLTQSYQCLEKLRNEVSRCLQYVPTLKDRATENAAEGAGAMEA